MKQTAFLIPLFLCLVLTSFTQDLVLPQRSSLGILMHPMNDSITRANGLTTGTGVYAGNILEGFTCDALGMKTGDVLLRINTTETNSSTDVIDAIGALRAGDPIHLSYARKGKVIQKKGKAVARPRETSEIADVSYGSFEYGGNHIRTILHTPIGIDHPPVVYYLQGYTCQSIDLAYSPNHTIRKLIDDWVASGYAVYRIEKPGLGDNQCEKGCMEIDFIEEVNNFNHGYEHLLRLPNIDTNSIFLFGHSLGGIVAPILGNNFTPKGIITYGTVVNSWFEYMQELTRVQGEMFHLSYEEIERDLRNATPFWYELFVANTSNTDILENDSIRAMLEREGALTDFENGYFMDRHYTFWASLHDVRFVDVWLGVQSNVLALYGALDIQALNADHIKTIAAIVNEQHPGKGTYEIIPNADHGFVYFDSMADNVNALNSGTYGRQMADHYHPGIAQSTVQWMNALR